MGLAPGLDPQHIGRSLEVVPAFGRGTPAVLADGLAGLSAGGLGAELLVPPAAGVQLVQRLAVAALAPPRGCHVPKIGPPEARQRRAAREEEVPPGRRPGRTPGTEEDDLWKGWEEDPG